MRTGAALVVLAASALPAGRADAAAALTDVGVYEGFGEGSAVAMAPLGGTGDQVVLGGRGLAVLDDNSLKTHKPRWSYHWGDFPVRGQGGDNQWITAVEPLRDPATGRTDQITSTSENELIRFDGRTGRIVWRRADAFLYTFGDRLSLVSQGAGKPPAIVGEYGTTAYSSADGSPLWTATVPEGDFAPGWVTAAQLTRGANPGVVFGAESDCGPGGGPDCTGHLFAYSGDGKRLWEVKPGGQTTSMVADDVTGDGLAETVAGDNQGHVSAYSPTGELLWRVQAGEGSVGAVAVQGGRVYAAADDNVVAFDAAGKRLWSQPMEGQVTKLEPADLGKGGKLLAAVAVASRVGRFVAVDPDRDGDRRTWQSTVYGRVNDFTVGTWHGRRVAIAGANDAVVHAVWADSGEPAFDYLGHSWVTGVDSGRVGQADAIAHTDDQGHVVLSDERGTELWRRWLGGDDEADAEDVVFADVGRSEPAIVAGGAGTQESGVVRAYDGRGAELWTGRAEGRIVQLITARLTASGPKAIVAAVQRGGSSGVAAFDARTGATLWEHMIGSAGATLAAADVDGDGLDEIAYSSKPYPPDTPGTFALLSPSGDVRWKQENFEIRDWLTVSGGAVIFGSRSETGSVAAVSAADGAPRWRTRLGSKVGFGTLVPQRSGVAASTDAGEVALLDAATGRISFRTRIVSEAATAGPLTLLPQGGGDPVIAVSESGGRNRTKVHVLSLDGRVLATSPRFQQGHGIDVAPTGGGAGVAVGAGLSVYSYRYR
ncbi:PQQ-binding-like beta-propeller repeat protein [Actinomadura decatromicini]|uniref:outer membrane protein assembly factor BamB family protein n=1 Tax=Actinomadura decatromicini TaxID=2604572 RepID=UPI0016530DFF|nr:PQQ-binding-like beta-propeller repeat protein [Actinomadura decatromicini]